MFCYSPKHCFRLGQGNHLDSYTINLESFRSFKGPLFRKPVTGQELFLLFLAVPVLIWKALPEYKVF